MSNTVTVSQADVVRAQLVIELNDSLGKPTAAYIRKIAAAKPVGTAKSAEPT